MGVALRPLCYLKEGHLVYAKKVRFLWVRVKEELVLPQSLYQQGLVIDEEATV